MQRTRRRKLGLAGIIAVVVVFMIAPLYVMIIMSVGDPQQTFATQHPSYVITHIDRAQPGDSDYTDTRWDNVPRWWTRVMTEPAPGGVRVNEDLLARAFKSLRVAFLTAGIALLIAVPAGYAISRLNSKLKYALIMFLFVSRMYPDVGLALPVSVTFLKLDRAFFNIPFYDTSIGYELVAAHLLLALPLATWVMVGAFDAVPTVLEEQAAVDGASRTTTLLRVLIPLVRPGIAVAGLFAWLASWEEVTYALFLSLTHRTLPTEIINAIRFSPPPVIATYAVLVTIPVVALTYAFGRKIQGVLLAGAVKG